MQWITTWNASILAISNVIIAIGTIILACGIPWSLWKNRREERHKFYATLDSTYFEIQKLIVENPHLSRPDPVGKTNEERIQYDAFAFLTWNFIEAISDYSKNDKFIYDTWYCILKYEAHLHDDWFKREEHQKKFKKCFIDEFDPKIRS
jgi:hypothetical protein